MFRSGHIIEEEVGSPGNDFVRNIVRVVVLLEEVVVVVLVVYCIAEEGKHHPEDLEDPGAEEDTLVGVDLHIEDTGQLAEAHKEIPQLLVPRQLEEHMSVWWQG